ncbi:MAG: hypothetical protein ABSD38_28920 [Syntrophorhabdales bacterium]|jgi:hypothetical protein
MCQTPGLKTAADRILYVFLFLVYEASPVSLPLPSRGPFSDLSGVCFAIDMLVVPETITMVFYLLGPVAGKMEGVGAASVFRLAAIPDNERCAFRLRLECVQAQA